MIGDSRTRPRRHRKTWTAREARFCTGAGSSGISRVPATWRSRTLMSRAPPLQIRRADRRAEAPRRRGHRGDRLVGDELLVPEREDQEPPDVPAVVRLELRVVPDHLLHVRRIEEPLL